MTKVTVPGNEKEVKQARVMNKAWLNGDAQTLAIIVDAVLQGKLYIVKACETAHEAWRALKAEYEPNNSLTVITIKHQISMYSCKPGDDPVAWLRVMIELYQKLKEADPRLMGDLEFAKTLVTLMTTDKKWRYC